MAELVTDELPEWKRTERRCLYARCGVIFQPKTPWQKFHTKLCHQLYWYAVHVEAKKVVEGKEHNQEMEIVVEHLEDHSLASSRPYTPKLMAYITQNKQGSPELCLEDPPKKVTIYLFHLEVLASKFPNQKVYEINQDASTITLYPNYPKKSKSVECTFRLDDQDPDLIIATRMN